jgi:hypothetical protein
MRGEEIAACDLGTADVLEASTFYGLRGGLDCLSRVCSCFQSTGLALARYKAALRLW